MLREYKVLFVNMLSQHPSPEEEKIIIKVDDVAEHQIEERLLDQAKISLSRKLKIAPKDVVVHGFTLISELSNIKVT
ncbi:hypothetical protein D3C77_346060 [compost metagenome]